MSRTKNRSNTASCKCTMEIPTLDDKEVEFTGSASFGNHGIGPYECHGYKGNDIQMGYEITGYEWDQSLFTVDENRAIEEWVDKNDSKLTAALEENLCDSYPDDEDPSDYEYDHND